MTTRRTLLLALSAGTMSAALPALAQQPGKAWRVGYLSVYPQSSGNQTYFLQGMRELGYIEGKNLVIEWRFAEKELGSLGAMATELVGLKVNLILANGTLAVSAAQKATTTIPIVMGTVGDPVVSGFVKSLSRPGGNITGTSLNTTDVSAKLLDLLQRTVPRLARVAVLVNPDNASHTTVLKNVEAAAQHLKLTLLPVQARTQIEIERGFATIAQAKAGAIYIAGEALFGRLGRLIAELAIKHRLPSIYTAKEMVEAGVLMSYGQNLTEQNLRGAAYADKIFKGAKPADLPVEQPTKFEMVINLKTANTLGLTIPKDLLLQSDRVIE